MAQSVYYNEIDSFCANWLKELMEQKYIPFGDVDTRSIADVHPDDLKPYNQCHFFAGIGGWALSLEQAGWGDQPVWTGSCPCQPFSTAGKRTGFADERHLWPVFFNLIHQRKPVTVFGEQVASKDAIAWLDNVQDDLEGDNYAVGSVTLPACGFGAPHIRQRIYWVANSQCQRRSGGSYGHNDGKRKRAIPETEATGSVSIGRLGNAFGDGCQQQREATTTSLQGECSKRTREYKESKIPRKLPGGLERLGGTSQVFSGRSDPDPTNGFWGSADWLRCRDDRWRAVEPGSFPLADGIPFRVGRLRGYGNAIVVPQASEFISAFLSTINDTGL